MIMNIYIYNKWLKWKVHKSSVSGHNDYPKFKRGHDPLFPPPMISIQRITDTIGCTLTRVLNEYEHKRLAEEFLVLQLFRILLKWAFIMISY